jgi:hypothetical protein
MSLAGQVFRLASVDPGLLGYAILLIVALLSMWLGYRYSRPTRAGASFRPAAKSFEGDLPTVVFAGAYEDAMFLKSLLESTGIHATFDSLPMRGRTPFESKVYVRRADADKARELVDDFRDRAERIAKPDN